MAEEVTEIQDTSVLALLQDALSAEHKGITVAFEGAEMIRTTKSGNPVSHNLSPRFSLVGDERKFLIVLALGHILRTCTLYFLR